MRLKYVTENPIIILILVSTSILIFQYQNCESTVPSSTIGLASSTATTPVYAAAIACGQTSSYTSSSSGITWSSDEYYSGGTAASFFSNAVINPPNGDGLVYQSNRDANFTYDIPVQNGAHQVVLKFAEYYWNSAGQRLFNVTINGTQVLSSFDIYATAGGKYTAVDQTFPVTVTNGFLTITAQTVKDNAQINGILIY